MKKNFYLIILVIIVIPVMNSCKKEHCAQMPSYTSTGKNTFGCWTNGKCWIAESYTDIGTGIAVPAVTGGFYTDANSSRVHLYIIANRRYSEKMELFVRNETSDKYLKPGRYEFNKKTMSLHYASSSNSYLIKSYGALDYNPTDSIHTGWIDIQKMDTINRIISGRFEFSTINDYNGFVSTITDGRFDIRN